MEKKSGQDMAFKATIMSQLAQERQGDFWDPQLLSWQRAPCRRYGNETIPRILEMLTTARREGNSKAENDLCMGFWYSSQGAISDFPRLGALMLARLGEIVRHGTSRFDPQRSTIRLRRWYYRDLCKRYHSSLITMIRILPISSNREVFTLMINGSHGKCAVWDSIRELREPLADGTWGQVLAFFRDMEPQAGK